MTKPEDAALEAGKQLTNLSPESREALINLCEEVKSAAEGFLKGLRLSEPSKVDRFDD